MADPTQAMNPSTGCAMKPHQAVRQFVELLRPYWSQQFGILGLLILSTTSSLASPYVIKVVIDEVLPKQDASQLLLLVAILLAVALVDVSAMFGVDCLYNWVSNRIMIELRTRLCTRVLHAPPAVLTRYKTGDVVYRINIEVDNIQYLATSTVIRFIHDCLMLVALTGILFWLNWRLFCASALAIPLFIGNLRYFQPRVRDITQQARQTQAGIMGFFQERLENVRLVQAVNGQAHEVGSLSERLRGLMNINMRSVVYSCSTRTISGLVMSLGPLVVLGWGGMQVMAGAMSVGTMVAFLQYLMRIFGPVQSLNSLYMDLVRASVSMGRIGELLEMPGYTCERAEVPNKLPAARGIAFQNVTVAYNGNTVLNGANLAVQAGRMYAIVGPSGCGKSTLLNLMCRFHDPDCGRVVLDDVDVRQVDLFMLRQRICLVSQEDQLFGGTIRENIIYGTWDAPDAAIMRTTALTGLDEFLSQHEGGLDTPIGERGIRLSGGQRQRLAIARACLRNAEILLLDEATSALDLESEAAIIEMLRRLYVGRTLVIVSHRPSAVRCADRILCIGAGKIMEEGSHADLISKNGIYQQWLAERNSPEGDVARAADAQAAAS